LIAVCTGHEIGVDLEYVKADLDIFEVAQRFFTEREVAVLHALPAARRIEAFHKCWTSKEAFLKAKGTGLSGQLDAVEIALDHHRLRVTADVPGWQLWELPDLQGYESALVTENGPGPAVSCYCWEPA
jgi:4'-phosphopantetheinyl transferase